MTLDKLKVAARQHEQRDEWREAIDLYRQAIRAAEGGEEVADPALYNRIGDLEQKAGNERAACEAWEQAAARYGEQGFFNNAIALCGKILRLDPSRLRTYLELARFQARKRVIYDVRQNLRIYHDQMLARGEGETAVDDLTRFGREFGSWKDLRGVLDELLGRDTAEDAGTTAGEGPQGGGLVFLDVDATRGETAPAPARPPASDEPLVLEPTSLAEGATPVVGTTTEGLEPTSAAVPERPGDAPEPTGMVEFERSVEAVGEPDQVAGLVTPEVGSDDVDQTEAITLDGFETTAMDVPPIESSAEVDLASEGDRGSAGIVFLDTDAAATDEAPAAADAAGEDSGEGGQDPLGARATAHALLEHGDRAGAISRLEESLEGYQREEDWTRAWQVATELIQAEPQAIARYQTRVEIAARMRDVERLCTSYMELGDALVAEGSNEKAIAVYRRVLELDEQHAGARRALRQMTPDAPQVESPEGFVDLGAMVIDDAGPRSTRMRTETTTISDDEDETFREALAEFKRALDQNLPVEDHQTHYDLGLAFKEMGLLEEAIGEFQKALRSPEGRLRTSEALGQCFFEQGRPAVAEAVLKSVERGDEGDAEKIGVLYWLGRALEAQGKTRNARGYYERVLAVDVGFADTGDRLSGLDGGEG